MLIDYPSYKTGRLSLAIIRVRNIKKMHLFRLLALKRVIRADQSQLYKYRLIE